MGPKSKDAVVAVLGHILEELLQQRELQRRTHEAVTEMARTLENLGDDHDTLKDHVAEIKRAARS